MINYLIIAVVCICVVFAVKSSVKQFRGEGSCCGGCRASSPVSKKLSGPVIAKKTVYIKGMTCSNCQAHVQNALNKIDGIAARVDLKTGTAEVFYEKEVSDDVIRNAVNAAGSYAVSDIKK